VLGADFAAAMAAIMFAKFYLGLDWSGILLLAAITLGLAIIVGFLVRSSSRRLERQKGIA